MTKLITIRYNKPSFGFGKATDPLRWPGVRFSDGQIAYQDETGEIRAIASEQKLLEALPGAMIEPGLIRRKKR